MERTAEARDNLLRVAGKFPDLAIIPYNLACYECQLRRLEKAKHWLEKAFKLGDGERMRLAALDDPDLEPLWKDIGKTLRLLLKTPARFSSSETEYLSRYTI